MADEPQPGVIAAFFATLQGRIISTLTIAALLLGIVGEGVTISRNKADAVTAQAAADNAARLKAAEAEERVWLARKAAEDAAAARAAADNAAKLRLAEAEERLQKSRTAKAEADVSPDMQAATLAAKQAEARKLDGEATKAQFIACAMDASKCTPEQRCIIEGQDNVGSRVSELSLALTEKLMGKTSLELSRNRKCADLRDATQYEQPQIPPQVPPRCRPLFADWQRSDAHTAFALTNTGNCVWSDGGFRSVEQAVADVRAHCWRQNFACTIIATK